MFKVINLAIFLLCFVVIFHFLVLLQIIPYQFVWGGRLENLTQMQIFETISIGVNGLLLGVLAMKAKYIPQFISVNTVTTILIIFSVLFAINTVGNVFAKMSLETMVFTPITCILAVSCYVLTKK